MATRRIVWIVLGAALLIAPAAFAQEEFKEFLSKEDFFSANFPGTPVVTNITWETEYGAKIPGRVYTITRPGPRSYSMTAVNYSPVQQIQTERAKACPDQRDELCTGGRGLPGAGYWRNDVRGAINYASAKYIENIDYHVTHFAWSFLGAEGVEYNELQYVNNKDKSRTFVIILMHHNTLYVMEETSGANAPPPGLFIQSLSLKESDGTKARHYGIYFNGPTIDPVEAQSCSIRTTVAPVIDAPNTGGAGNPAGPRPGVNFCESLPAPVRYQQGPNFSYTAAQ